MKLQKLLKKLALPVFALVVVSMLAACSSPSGGNSGGGGDKTPELDSKKEYEISTDRLDEYEPEPHEFSSEEEKKAYAKKMFRKIAKNIHPGVNPLYETTKKIQDLYEELQNSYKECDVRMLDIIEHEVELILKE